MKLPKKNFLLLFLCCSCLIGCSEIIEVPDISNQSVMLTAPFDNATLDITNLTLSWNKVEDAEQYEVQIAYPNFEEILQLVEDTSVSENSISVSLEAGTTYQWRVRAVNSGYVTPYTIYSFTIE